MWKISKRQRWIVLGHDDLGGFCDPARRGDRRRRSPELEQRKEAKAFGQPLAQRSRHRIKIWKFAAVGLVDRTRRRAHVVARRHIVPPEHIGAREGVVAFLAG